MRAKKKITLISTLTFFILLNCVDPYQPKISSQETDFLIVHGHINGSNNTAMVNLTRTINLYDTSRYNPESGSSVMIEDLDYNKIVLTEVSSGIYSGSASFAYDNRYRLIVRSKDSKTYYSEFIELEHSAITSIVNWNADENQFEVIVNAADSISGHKYYRFTYEETFEYRSYYQSHYHFVNGQVEPRSPVESIFQCWTTLPSRSILLETTENLNQNSITDLPIIQIEKGDKRLNYNYSILIKQITLNQEAYNYWHQLRKTSESLGGLFDPIPSSITGNIKSETESKVLGYFSGGDVTEKRILVSSLNLPDGYRDAPEENCDEDQMPIANIDQLDGAAALITTEYGGFRLEGYYYTTPECGDCRLKGGINKRPPFMN